MLKEIGRCSLCDETCPQHSLTQDGRTGVSCFHRSTCAFRTAKEGFSQAEVSRLKCGFRRFMIPGTIDVHKEDAWLEISAFGVRVDEEPEEPLPGRDEGSLPQFNSA